MNFIRKIIISLIFISITLFITAQNICSDYAVLVSSSINEKTPSITFNIVNIVYTDTLYILRKPKQDTSWADTIAKLIPASKTFTDFNVKVGEEYEYAFIKASEGYKAYSYMLAGIKYPVTEYRGKIILLVDNRYSQPLKEELKQLEYDFIGDGWGVIRIDVDRDSSVTYIKSLIKKEYIKDKDVKSLFLFGHVPVPYAGQIYPDSHQEEHEGAWPADCYYADMDGSWTDFFINFISPSGRPELNNVPGDGKFDESWYMTSEIETGRVDMYKMPSFTLSDTGLLKQYLDKDHKYKHGQIPTERRGLIDDDIGTYRGEAFAANGWRNFSVMFGPENIKEGYYLNILQTQNYLWSYACGYGTYNTIKNVMEARMFNDVTVKSVFTMYFGSFFGDWNFSDALLKAPLASKDQNLVCFWAGRPNWHLHHMALGETIGYSYRITQNTKPNGLYHTNYGGNFIHIALMGDPTLRMHIVKPPSKVIVHINFSKNTNFLRWESSDDNIIGYNIYRSNNMYNKFTKINNEAVTDNYFMDTIINTDTNIYMVRAVKLESSASGSYYNLSQGIFGLNDTTMHLLFTSSKKDVICYNAKTGYAEIKIFGSHPPYKIKWSTGSDSLSVKEVGAGTYYCTISDTLNNLYTDSITILQPSKYETSILSISDTNKLCKGKINLTIYGGTAPYQYTWNEPKFAPIPDIDNVCQGKYAITITDANNCIIADSIFVDNYTTVNDSYIPQKKTFTIIPNPSADGIFYINNITGSNFKIIIYNIIGNKMYSETFNSNFINKINLSNLPKGMYEIQIISDDNTIFNYKLVIN